MNSRFTPRGPTTTKKKKKCIWERSLPLAAKSAGKNEMAEIRRSNRGKERLLTRSEQSITLLATLHYNERWKNDWADAEKSIRLPLSPALSAQSGILLPFHLLFQKFKNVHHLSNYEIPVDGRDSSLKYSGLFSTISHLKSMSLQEIISTLWCSHLPFQQSFSHKILVAFE